MEQKRFPRISISETTISWRTAISSQAVPRSPLYFTQNMWIEHNFIYKCSYSAMSIGWGWCNFDGEVGSDSQLPDCHHHLQK